MSDPNGAAPTSTSVTPTVTTAGPGTTSTSPPTSTTTTEPATTTTATVITASPTTTIGSGGVAVFTLSQIVFGDAGYLLITNAGSGRGDIGGYWLCRRPNYFAIPSAELAPGESVAVALGPTVPDVIGVVATFDLEGALGVIDVTGGELGLYQSSEFDSVTAIVDYVEWVTTAHGRSAFAVEAGLWPEGGFVDIPVATIAISSTGGPGAGPEDWVPEIGV